MDETYFSSNTDNSEQKERKRRHPENRLFTIEIAIPNGRFEVRWRFFGAVVVARAF